MSKNKLEISSESAVSMPMKNLIAIVGAVAMGVWAYFGVIERLNKLETNTTLLEKDLPEYKKFFADTELKTEERINESEKKVEDSLKGVVESLFKKYKKVTL